MANWGLWNWKIFTGNINQIQKMLKWDDNTIISCSDDDTIWILDSYEADNVYFLTGHEDKKIILHKGKCIIRIDKYLLICDILLIVPYNNSLIWVSDDKSIQLWKLDMKECANAIKTHDIPTCLWKLRNTKFIMGEKIGLLPYLILRD